jgi:hypothetical protein
MNFDFQLYVNAEKVGHAIYPLDRPPNALNDKKWNVKPMEAVTVRNSAGIRKLHKPPFYMVGLIQRQLTLDYRHIVSNHINYVTI